MRGVRIIGALILVVGATSCAQRAASELPVQNHRSEQRMLTFDVGAPVDASYSGSHEMQFFERTADDPKFWNMRLATISTKTPIDIGSDTGLIIGISIVGRYEGQGSYEIAPRGDIVKPTAGEVPDLSVIRIETYDLSKPAPVLIDRWDNTATCRVTIGADAATGVLHCPADGDPDGSFDVNMSWGAS